MAFLDPSRAIEILEARIAPAVLYFVQSNALAVHKGDGSSAQDTQAENDAQANAHADFALLMNAGDELIFDADHNNQFSPGDQVLARISAGRAMLFLTDGAGPHAGAFDASEITGVAASNGFRASFFTDINGSVVTALDATGHLSFSAGTLNVEHAAIVGLTVTGQINGSVVAGTGLSNIRVDGASAFSVTGLLATGTGVLGSSASLNDGANYATLAFTPAPGENGGNITHVVLPFGASGIHAGDGGDTATGHGGAGGSVSGVTSLQAGRSMTIEAGTGGDATTSGTGGRGGSITGCTLSADPSSVSIQGFVAGSGGDSASGPGGKGGSVKNLNAVLIDTAAGLTVLGGSGGDGGGTGNGGVGGSLASIAVQVNGISSIATIEAGGGGESGAAGGNGGAGGMASGVHFTAMGNAIGGSFFLTGGLGGGGFARSGAGGLNTGSVVNLQADAVDVTVSGGDGGTNQNLADSIGGPGGNLVHATVTAKSISYSLSLGGGNGGESVNAAGSRGGSVLNGRVTTLGAVTGVLVVGGGNAGTVLGVGNGATGGALRGLAFTNKGGTNLVNLRSGAGGTVLDQDLPAVIVAQGNGGASGAVSGIVIKNYAEMSIACSVLSGSGGQVAQSEVGDAGHGGASGGVSGVVIDDFFAGGATGNFAVFAGPGKAGVGPSARGGNMGAVKNITLSGASSRFVIGSEANFGGNAGSGADAAAGAGGSISNIHGTVQVLDIIAGRGGSSIDGTGGGGGSVSNVNVSATDFIHWIAAGDGGSGGAHPGAGGSVMNVKTAANIGDFTKTFGLSSLSSVQGGLSAGQGGSGPSLVETNGAILNVTAKGIATIIAGRPAANAVSSLNGVRHIAGIHAQALGAETNIPGDHQVGNFDFNEGGSNGTYEPQLGDETTDGDTAIDGLVVVDLGGGGLALPVQPLLLVQTD